MNYHFFAMLSRMKYICRWSLMRNTRTENICEHSQDVAVLVHALALLHNKRFDGTVNVERCVLYALYHDVREILTGDLPTRVKYNNPDIQNAYHSLETVAAKRLLEQLPDDLCEEYRPLLLPEEEGAMELRLVKAADKLAALIKCIEELKAGNKEFLQAKRSTEKALKAMKLAAVDCFMKEFLPSFELTLDEQK